MTGPDARRALARVQLPDDLVARLVREIDVELAVLREVRRERDREQALLAAGLRRSRAGRRRACRDLAVRTVRMVPACSTTNSRLSPGAEVDVDRRAQARGDLDEPERRRRAALPPVCDQATCAPRHESRAARATRIRVLTLRNLHAINGDEGNGLTSAADGVSTRSAKTIWPPGARPGTTARACSRAAPADLRHEAATLGLVERFAGGPRERPSAVGALRRHFAFRQETRLALDLHVRPSRAAGASGARCSCSYWPAPARSGPCVIRSYAPEGDRAWDALAVRHSLQIVEIDRFLLLEVDHATISSEAVPDARALARRAGASAKPGSSNRRLHAALDTSAPYVPETFAAWRARVWKPRAAARDRPRDARARRRARGICALRVCVAQPGTIYHAFTGVAESARGRATGGRSSRPRSGRPRAGRAPADR